jgi:hypothetical protein
MTPGNIVVIFSGGWFFFFHSSINGIKMESLGLYGNITEFYYKF